MRLLDRPPSRTMTSIIVSPLAVGCLSDQIAFAMTEKGMAKIQVGSISVAVSDAGDGPPVVLLHGLACGKRMWFHQIPALRRPLPRHRLRSARPRPHRCAGRCHGLFRRPSGARSRRRSRRAQDRAGGHRRLLARRRSGVGACRRQAGASVASGARRCRRRRRRSGEDRVDGAALGRADRRKARSTNWSATCCAASCSRSTPGAIRAAATTWPR